MSQDIPLFIIALNCVALFLALTIGRTRPLGAARVPSPDLVHGRFTLGCMAMTVVALASGAGIGVGALFGATFHSVIALVPLIALGVQVDDCIITVNTLGKLPR